jgi:hypothetical protein
MNAQGRSPVRIAPKREARMVVQLLTADVSQQVAARLRKAAEILGAQGANRSRVAAYRNAADLVERRPDIRDIFLRSGREGLAELPGIGSGLAAAIAEMLETGCQGRDRARFCRRGAAIEAVRPAAARAASPRRLAAACRSPPNAQDPHLADDCQASWQRVRVIAILTDGLMRHSSRGRSGSVKARSISLTKRASASCGRWLMPPAARRPPPLGNLRQRTSAPEGDACGARTLTVYPPSRSGVRTACARSA